MTDIDVDEVVPAAADSLPVSMAIVDADGEIRWTNRSWREFGRANDADESRSSIGVNYFDVTNAAVDEDAAEAARGIRAVLDGDRETFSMEYPCHSPDERRWFTMWVASFTHDGDRFATVAHFDVTERVTRERELAELNEKLDAIIEASPEAITVEDGDGLVRLWNDGAEEMFGWSEAAVMGERNPAVPDAIREEYMDDLADVYDGDVIDGIESIRTRRDGTEFPVTVSAAPVRDADGEIIGVMAVTRDITERKRREEDLRHKNVQLEALNSVVRHDIRNDMQVIIGWLDVLRDDVDEEGQELIEKVLRNGEHVVELTETARELVEATVEGDVADTVEPVALAPVVESELEKRREMYPDATFVLDGSIPDVYVRASSMLSSVFANLLNNAVQHNDRETPTVEVSVTETDESVIVAVADDGPGIPDSRKDVIFGKGNSDLSSEGTGIGLYLVRSLTEGFGGRVWVEDREKRSFSSSRTQSDDPRGAVFNVELPKADPDESADGKA
ncbi:MAG: PAS domain S-box protein [Haloarculaceae archaeon]